MKKRKFIGLFTIVAGLPGLAGLWLIGQLGDLPLAAKVIVFNAIFFRGICGSVGGILIWRGGKWGYYLCLITWLYLVVVSVLTIFQLYNSGLSISFDLLDQDYSNFGRPFLISLLKIVFGIPIIYIIFNDFLSDEGSVKHVK